MELAPRLACCPSGASPPSQDATTARQAACCTRRSMIAGRAGASPTQGTVAAGELVSEGFTELLTDLPRQRNDGDRHASDAAADSQSRSRRGVCPAGGSTATASTTTAAASTLRHDDNRAGTDSAGSAPARSERIQKPPGGRRWAAAPGGRCDRGREGRRSTSAALHRVLAASRGLRRGLQARVPDAQAAAGHRHAVQRGVQRGACAARVQLPGMRHCANRRCPGAGGADQRGAALCRSAGACVVASKVTACSRTPTSSIT
jgi:hypothetical protein